MMAAIIKETGQGGGASTAVLQLITRCLEVTPVYTHTHAYTQEFHTVFGEREEEKTQIHSCGLILSVDHVFVTHFKVKVERKKTKR